uniref:Transmembrane protein 268 n=1 Tax=Salvator merianae TaxID=96440 RepID=A0A8D0BUN7_SALMN
MACGESRGSTEEREELPFTISYCRPQEKEYSDYWKTGKVSRLQDRWPETEERMEPLNGDVLLVVTAHEPSFSRPLDLDLWIERLKTLGIQMTVDQWKHLIQGAVLVPEVRRHLFYTSQAFGIIIAVVVYMTFWINLYSTLQIYSIAKSWEISILVTGLAVAAAVVIRLIIHGHQNKMNVNTDMRLSAANEAFMKNQFIVGVTDFSDKLHSSPQLWFVHFNMEPCVRSLADSLSEMKRNQQSALKNHLNELCIILEMAVLPSAEETTADPLEETPLLTERRNSNRGALTCHQLLQLVSDEAPDMVAQQLLTIFSSNYVRLLVTSQLPKASAERHLVHGRVLCLCQFVEIAVLGQRCSWFKSG